MLYDFEFTLENLDGTPILQNDMPCSMCDLLANYCMNYVARSGDEIIKFYKWGHKLSQDGCLDLDDNGKREFRLFITQLDGVSVYIKGKVFEVLDNPIQHENGTGKILKNVGSK